MPGIRSVRMTNPEGICDSAGAQGGNYKNTITVILESCAATPGGPQATLVTGYLMKSYCASMKRVYGDYHPQPTKLRGNIVGIEVPEVASWGVAGTLQLPHSHYHLHLRRGSPVGAQYAATGWGTGDLHDLHTATGNPIWLPFAVTPVDNDIWVRADGMFKGAAATLFGATVHTHITGFKIHME